MINKTKIILIIKIGYLKLEISLFLTFKTLKIYSISYKKECLRTKKFTLWHSLFSPLFNFL
ncbi:hypothetical protein D1N77_11870 [Clostridioides difficile]|nr:hypothetical protein D1N77_11870 [Clostridioides difficile]